jgi:hypothetical protein
MPKEKALILLRKPYSKYVVLSRYGVLKEAQHANLMELPGPDATVPPELQPSAELIDLYLREFNERKRSLLSIDTLITRVLEVFTEPVSARVEMREVKEGDTELRPVVKIKQTVKRKAS